jgi:hypothetical protein
VVSSSGILVYAKQNLVWPRANRGISIFQLVRLTALGLVSFPAGAFEDCLHNVLQHKQAERAASLLSRWLSGYAFFFVDTNFESAGKPGAALAVPACSGAKPMRLGVQRLAFRLAPMYVSGAQP